MEYESPFSSRAAIIYFSGSVISFIGAGYALCEEKYMQTVLFLIAGLILSLRILNTYRVISKAALEFFESMGNDDTSFRFPDRTDSPVLSELYGRMNKLKDHYQAIKVKNEFNEAYYRSIIQHSSAGLLVMGEDGSVELINKAACRFAGISPDLTNTSNLKTRYPAFFSAVSDIKPGENLTFRNIINNSLHILSFRATSVKRQEKQLKLVSIHDIRNELEARELESYRKLMNVMTHEIMNLLTPLTTVAKELHSSFDRIAPDGELKISGQDTLSSVRHGLGLIGEHGDSLMSFVNSYKKISRLPEPRYENIDPAEWAAQLKIAFLGRMESDGITFSVNCDKTLKVVTADKKLLNQCIINILNNGIDAVRCNDGERRIDLNLISSVSGKIMIRICNNGPSIPPSVSDKIFVPFFTTKAEGSGIGLSIAQEIVKLHHGSLTVLSSEGENTCFVIELLGSSITEV